MSMSIVTLFLVYVINYTLGYFGTEINKNDECFCEVRVLIIYYVINNKLCLFFVF